MKPVITIKTIRVTNKAQDHIDIRWSKATVLLPTKKSRYFVRWCVSPYKDDKSCTCSEELSDASSYSIKGLTPNTSYDIIVSVKDEQGNESRYNKATARTLGNTAPTISDKIIKVKEVTTDTISISWTKATDSVTPQNKLTYSVTWCVAPYNYDDRKKSERLTDGSQYLVEGLKPGTTYDIVVYVRDEHGYDATYGTLTVTTRENLPPTIPDKYVTIGRITNTGIGVYWKAAKDPDGDKSKLRYNVQWCEAPFKTSKLDHYGGISEDLRGIYGYDIKGLEEGTEYDIRVAVWDDSSCAYYEIARVRTTGGE